MATPEEQQTPQQRAGRQHGPTPDQRRATWHDLVEERLREAQQRGDFDNLPGAGKPLRIQENVHAGARALAYSVLHSAGVPPPEIARGQEIDAELRAAEELLATLRHRRDVLHRRLLPPFAGERRAYNVLLQTTRARYAEALRSVQSKVLSLNILAPPALHRAPVPVEDRLRAFDEEFVPEKA